MKKVIFIPVFMFLTLMSVFSGGAFQLDLVNTQEISLKQIEIIEIRYSSDNISLHRSNTENIIIKEYMNKDNSDYYAKISNSGNKLEVRAGKRPISIIGNNLRRRIEVHIPALDNKSLILMTSSGNIEGKEEYMVSSMTLECASGNITFNSVNGDIVARCHSGNIKFDKINGNASIETTSGDLRANSINGDVIAKCNSGNITFGKINGNASIETTSGYIKADSIKGDTVARCNSGEITMNEISGSLTANVSSGNIHCGISKNSGDISLSSSSGNVTLDISRNLAFNFSSRTRSGTLRTPFQDKLYIALSDKNNVNGVINGDKIADQMELKNINVSTSSGSIKVTWSDKL